MAMSYVWVILLFVSVVFGALTGSAGAVGAAAVQGAESAVELTLSLAGPMIFYSALLKVMERSGLTEKLSRALRPVLGRLFPSSRSDPELAGELSCNMSANLLGLGNAATPAGIRAAQRLHALSGKEAASDELCRLAVLNTASIQLLPTTAAALRSACGAENAFDILPAVWISSAAAWPRGCSPSDFSGERHENAFSASPRAACRGRWRIRALLRNRRFFRSHRRRSPRASHRGAHCAGARMSAPGGRRAARFGRDRRIHGAAAARALLSRHSAGDRAAHAAAPDERQRRACRGRGYFHRVRRRLPRRAHRGGPCSARRRRRFTFSPSTSARRACAKHATPVPAALCADLAGFLAAAFCVNVLHL